MKRLTEVLEGREGNSIMPFFWQHGESKETLCEYMEKIQQGGCGGVCVEARPHPDFVKDGWWADIGCILEKAKKEQMEVWILDDSHFPTGYANGLVAEKYPQYLKKYLDCRRFDMAGPLQYARINLNFLKGRPWDKKDGGKETILGIYAAKRAGEAADRIDPVLTDTLADITHLAKDGILYWDIPKGNWSVFVVFMTRMRGEDATKDYLNPLIKEATDVLIEAVYEPHYAHFGEYFGNTLTAFFSDEPRFGNAKGTDKCIGRTEMVLPWRDGLEEELPFPKEFLPFLFADSADDTMHKVRYLYMDCVTKLYSENFTQVLGGWCKAHGVKYVGHHIEDNGAHARLGYGAGHLFRAQKGQDFSGIDVVFAQIAPGYDFHHDAFPTGGNDGVFYHHALAHLGSSVAWNDPDKHGIAMCEAFGAYGWGEGLKWMKWIIDHLLVRGINYFVPHAFDPKEYPDGDCPPHFYAHGNNPQFRYFPILMHYAQRMCHLLQGGVAHVSAAVLYHAKGEWCGVAQPVELILRELDRNQIGAAIVPLDALDGQAMENGAFSVNKNRYECLIVPAMERMPEEMAKKLLEMCKSHIPVLFVDRYPAKIVDGETEENARMLGQLSGMAQKISLKTLAAECAKWKTIRTAAYAPDLAAYHYCQPDGDIFMLFNGHPADSMKTAVTLPGKKTPMLYDAFANRLYPANARSTAEGIEISVSLSPYESMAIIALDDWSGYPAQAPWKETLTKRTVLDGVWKLSFADAKSYAGPLDAAGFVELGERSVLLPLSSEPEFMDKTGTVRYETAFVWTNQPDAQVFVDLGTVYETAEVFVNGKSQGVCICPPYRAKITDAIVEGTNRLAVEVTNTLGNENKDFLSHYVPIEPFGLLGPVALEVEL